MEQPDVNCSTADDYGVIEEIGDGSYGTIYKGIHKKNNHVVAMKKINLTERKKRQGVPSNILREISILKELKHPNIVRLLDVILEDDLSSLQLIFEFLSMDLRKHLDSLKPCEYLCHDTVRSYLHQILQGTLFCHIQRIVHRDLKPENLLISINGVIKIGDFGLARAFSVPVEAYTQGLVTLSYRAPEILLGCEQYSCPIDIWSIGCIFAEMATKETLFEGESEIDQLLTIFRIMQTPTEDIWPGVSSLKNWKITFPRWKRNNLESCVDNLDQNGIGLLQKMLLYDPSKRISAREALQHPYFDKLDKSKLPAKNF